MKLRPIHLWWVGAAFLLTPLSTGCGYSEDEWQAQLARYDQLAKSRAELQRELEAAQARVRELSEQLESMGVKLDDVGSKKAALARDLAEMKQALAEYKQRAAALERIKARFELLRQKLEKMTELGLDVKIRRNRMVISLPGDVLFRSGEDELSKKGKKILLEVAEVISSDSTLSGRQYQVAGHTDNQPLRRTANQFKDNWGLSVMRAREVVVTLVTSKKDKGAGLPTKNWSAAGYGDTDPIASNATPEGRQKNRRVELVLMPNVEEMLDLQSLVTKPE